jgi:hypothetical protein
MPEIPSVRRFVSLMTLLLLPASIPFAHAKSLQISWDPSPDSATRSYVLYYGEQGGTTVNRMVVGSTASGTLTGLGAGRTYVIYATALGDFGTESAPSNLLVYTAPSNGQQLLINGSFESGYNGWSGTGNQNTTAPAGTDGTTAVQFNSGDSLPNAVLSQTFTTTVGQQYEVSFDLSAVGYFAQLEQRLVAAIYGDTLLTAKVFSVFSSGTGTQFKTQTFTFTADGPAITLTFMDVSPVTVNVDMLLDNVQVTTQLSQ